MPSANQPDQISACATVLFKVLQHFERISKVMMLKFFTEQLSSALMIMKESVGFFFVESLRSIAYVLRIVSNYQI